MEKRKKWRKVGISLLILSAIILWLYWGNTSIQVSHFQIYDTDIPANFDGFTIVQVSDLHNAEFGQGQATLIRAVERIEPDLIAVTGDLIDSSRPDVAKAMAFIDAAVNLAPVYFVSGNHEAWTGEYAELKEKMLAAGVVLLDDESTEIEADGEFIHLLGLEDPAFLTGSEFGGNDSSVYMDGILASISNQATGFEILLSHRPELFDLYVDHNINLILSGHAHGGQIRLPFFGGLVAPDQGLFPDYMEGVYEENNSKMVVSRGLGNSIIPLRINNRPELIVVTLTSSY